VSTSLSGSYSDAGLAPTFDGVRCLVHGRVEGISELKEALGLEDPSIAPEGVLFSAFARRRERTLAGLRGTFVLLLWDGAAGEGLLAVDPLGSGSLFFHGDGSRLSFATEVTDLLAMLPAGPAPDEHALARWIAYRELEPHETLMAGVRRLPGGHYLRLSDGRWSEQYYWRPTFTPTRQLALDEAGGLVREALERSVARSCAGESTGIMLSGGLDSGSVAAAAVTSLQGRSELRAYTATFPSHPEVDESALVDVTTTALGLPSRRHASEADGVLAASAEHVEEWRLPAASPNLFFQRPLLALARADGTDVVLDGQGGDELFGYSPFVLAHLLRGLRLPTLLRLAHALSGGDLRGTRRALGRYALCGAAPQRLRTAWWAHRSRGPQPMWLTPSAAAVAGEPPGRAAWSRLDGPRWWCWLADVLTAGRERMGVHDHLRRKLASERLVGAHPLLADLDLIELALALPPELAFQGHLDRPVMREALRGLLPDPIRLRPTKSYFNELLVDALSGRERSFLTTVLAPRSSHVRAYVTTERLRELTEGPLGTEHPYRWASSAWRLAATELWLKALAGERLSPLAVAPTLARAQ
jgi:asparagine synthase (glutamine-hydrolysing)